MVAQIVAQARGVAKELLHGGQLAQISRQSLLQKRCLNLSPLPLGRTAHLQKQQRINSRAQQQNCRGSNHKRSLSPRDAEANAQHDEDERHLHQGKQSQSPHPHRRGSP